MKSIWNLSTWKRVRKLGALKKCWLNSRKNWTQLEAVKKCKKSSRNCYRKLRQCHQIKRVSRKIVINNIIKIIVQREVSFWSTHWSNPLNRIQMNNPWPSNLRNPLFSPRINPKSWQTIKIPKISLFPKITMMATSRYSQKKQTSLINFLKARKKYN